MEGQRIGVAAGNVTKTCLHVEALGPKPPWPGGVFEAEAFTQQRLHLGNLTTLCQGPCLVLKRVIEPARRIAPAVDALGVGNGIDRHLVFDPAIASKVSQRMPIARS